MNNKLAEQAVTESKKKYELQDIDTNSFLTIMDFLDQFPSELSCKLRHDPQTIPYYSALADKFFKARTKLKSPKVPQTEPDKMVSYILEVYFDYSQAETERIKLEHQLSMAAENIIGALLELYIGSILEQHGWASCSGNFIKHVDLIKKNIDGTWILLQIKNRDNTENSSSNKVREGKNIIKWHRSFSKKKANGIESTNWDKFPDENLRHLMSEDKFKAFVKSYLLNSKNPG